MAQRANICFTVIGNDEQALASIDKWAAGIAASGI